MALLEFAHKAAQGAVWPIEGELADDRLALQLERRIDLTAHRLQTALRIGVLSLKAARGTIDGGTIRHEGERLLLTLEERLSSHREVLDEARFTAFAQAHALNSSQLRFLAMLKDHIRHFGALNVNQLFEAPFTAVHSEGLGGVFPNETQLDDVVRLVRSFGEPVSIHQQP